MGAQLRCFAILRETPRVCSETVSLPDTVDTVTGFQHQDPGKPAGPAGQEFATRTLRSTGAMYSEHANRAGTDTGTTTVTVLHGDNQPALFIQGHCPIPAGTDARHTEHAIPGQASPLLDVYPAKYRHRAILRVLQRTRRRALATEGTAGYREIEPRITSQ